MTKLLVIVYLWLHISHSYLLQSNRYHKWDKNVQSIVSYSRLNLIYKREICKSTNTQLNASNADADKEMIPSNLVVQIVRSLSEVDRDVWNQFSDSKTSPFLDYDWLYILEQSGCVVANKGWDPVHLLVTSAPDTNSSIFRNESTGKISVAITSATNVLAACPLYVKYHSAGEFIFDQEWAQFAESRLRLPYYPKLLSSVPFTPGTGARILLHPTLSDSLKEQCSQTIIEAMKGLAWNNRILSSNVNFMLDSELPLFRSAGYDLRQTVQYRWINRNPNTGQMYSDFEEYLSCFKSKRRVEIKRERKQVKEQGIRMEVFRGDDPRATRELFETIHDIYATTIEKMWGQQYLSKQFFSMLSDASINFKRKIVFVLAYNENDRIVAGTFNLASETHFYGRYWGAFEYIKHLHFEACYYAAIEFCIQNRVLYMEPGAGGGEYKFLRGFDPFLIHSVHYFTNPTMQAAVAEFLVQEREINKETIDYLVQNSAVAGASSSVIDSDADSDSAVKKE